MVDGKRELPKKRQYRVGKGRWARRLGVVNSKLFTVRVDRGECVRGHWLDTREMLRHSGRVSWYGR